MAAKEQQYELDQCSTAYAGERLYGVRTCPDLGIVMIVLRHTKLFVHGMEEVVVPTLISPRSLDVHYDPGDPDVPGSELGFLLAHENYVRRAAADAPQESSPAAWLIMPLGAALQHLEIHTSGDLDIQRVSEIGSLTISAYSSAVSLEELQVGTARASIDGPYGSLYAARVICAEEADVRSRGTAIVDAESFEHGLKPISRTGVVVVTPEPSPVPVLVNIAQP